MGIQIRIACRLIVVAALCGLGLPGSAASAENGPSGAAFESIRAEDLRKDIGFLTSPNLEGREAGTQGGYAAAEYLRGQLAALGLPGACPKRGYFQPFAPNFRNVLAVLGGSDPHLKHQIILVGAHYDHIGREGVGERAPQKKAYCPGADDNASGTAAVLALARAFRRLPQPPRRSILFAFWDAEEKGMLGSTHFVTQGADSLDVPGRVVLAVNLDMIGRLRDDHLHVLGTRTSYGLRRLVSRHNDRVGLAIDFPWAMDPKADHYPFYNQGIPVLVPHTGLHEDYHRPADTAASLHVAGMQRIAGLMLTILVELANRPEGPSFREAARSETESTRLALERQTVTLPQRLGASWQSRSAPGRGLVISEVVDGSGAARAGLRPGDRILRFAGREVRTDLELQTAVMIAPARVRALVEHRGRAEPSEVTVELQGHPFRVGITWRVDDAEPGTVTITHVVDPSPAFRAGLKPGDRLYQVNGRDFSGELELYERLRTPSGPLRIQVERDGRLRDVEIDVEATPLPKAA